MKIIRTTIIETEDFQIGDRIGIDLAGFGSFKVTDKGILFVFDEYDTPRPMNNLSICENPEAKMLQSNLKIGIIKPTTFTLMRKQV